MPIDYKKYPPHWKQFSKYIRFERAGNKCEECGVLNRKMIERGELMKDGLTLSIWFDMHNGKTYDADTGKFLGHYRSYDLDLDRLIEIILTVAHLDRETDGICRCEIETGFKCANPDHVKAMCQRCHLIYDKEKHAKNRRKTIAKQKDSTRDLLAMMEA